MRPLHGSGVSELHRNVYEQVFETWRSEVDSYWQRNSYFAAFETAALAGCWYVLEKGHIGTSLTFAVFGLISAAIWFLTSIAVHNYVQYWWDSIKKIELKLSLDRDGLDFARKHTGSGGLHPSLLVFCVPLLFAAAWAVIAVLSMCAICCHACHLTH